MAIIDFQPGADIFTRDVDALVNPVNCVGVMGAGLALQFKQLYPDNFRAYVAACHRGHISPGNLFVHPTFQPSTPHYIINFPTKRHWRDPSRLDDILLGLTDLAFQIDRLRLRSIALPRLGCGLGGLSWPAVRRATLDTLQALPDIHVVVCAGGPRTLARPGSLAAVKAGSPSASAGASGSLDPAPRTGHSHLRPNTPSD